MTDSGPPQVWWRLGFLDLTRPWQPLEHEVADSWGDGKDLSRANSGRHGTPYFINPEGRPDARLNAYWRDPVAMHRKNDPKTWRKYAYSIVLWLDFLHSRQRAWDQSSTRDWADFVYARRTTTDARGRRQAGDDQLAHDRTALSQFYDWASGAHDVPNPIGLLGGSGRTDAVPGGQSSGAVRWLTPTALRQWRDIGLGGLTPDGGVDDAYRGRSNLIERNLAFTDCLYGSALRLTEGASLMLSELPWNQEARRLYGCRLADACAKRGRGRSYVLPKSAFDSIVLYVDGPRRKAVEQARQKGRYIPTRGTVIEDVRPLTRQVKIAGSWRSFDVLDPDERRSLLLTTEDGFEPVLLWLSEAGVPVRPKSWDEVFDGASRRVAAVLTQRARDRGVDPRRVEIPWCTPHMLRHSAALRWYAIGLAVEHVNTLDMTKREREQYLRDRGTQWQPVKSVLGHVSEETTKATYLEPFNLLNYDFLLSVLTVDERGGIDGLVQALARVTGRVITGMSMENGEVDEVSDLADNVP